MKRSIMLFILGTFLMVGCITTQPIPKEDIIILVPTPFGIIPALIEKGHFDNPDNYFTVEQWKQLHNKYKKQKYENNQWKKL